MENGSGKVVAVTGVTGSQGGATARALLAAGWKVRGLTRKASTTRARALAARGVDLVEGDMGDGATMKRLLAGAHGLFLVTDFWRNGVAGEERHGNLALDLAAKLGTAHVVHATAALADRVTGIPHIDSKHRLERRLEELKLPATVLRPAIFMDGLLDRRSFPAAPWGMIPKVVGWDKPLHWVAVEDIGAVAARAFADPERFVGKRLTLVGDRLTIRDAHALFERVMGRKPFRLPMPVWAFERLVSRDFVTMWRYFRDHELGGSVEESRRLHPLRSMEAWLRGRTAGPVS